MAKATIPCDATLAHPTANKIIYKCMRRGDHVLKPGKYARQHMDAKTPPAYYWDATDEDIANFKAKLTTE